MPEDSEKIARLRNKVELKLGGRTAWMGYLQEACAGDSTRLHRIESLLNAHMEAGTFLENSPAAMQTMVNPVGADQPNVAGTVEQPGDRVGRYKLLQQIGEGGCGIVYMADQEEPIRRRVALKVIKLGMDTKSVIARFEAERQALALMDHPSIAKVFDAGATDNGRPYFVMELVRGVPITQYCDEANLPIRERLDLFIQVCHAIQHAHQKGIIHRDIKPSNILVTVNGGTALPKVIDFGIAKATNQQPLTDKTLFTAFEQFIGTPAYMSPEQAGMTSLDIDTRSDIYALGVLLYELITGRTPFDTKDLMKAGLDEIRRTIREVEPDRPSTRLSKMINSDLKTVAKQRHAQPDKLPMLICGDLDWIVMRALEKDRARRYESSAALSEDIQRHLSNEPVRARPPTPVYRFQKMVRRNKMVFAAGSSVLAALVVGLGASTWLFLRERQAHRRAVAAEDAERSLRLDANRSELVELIRKARETRDLAPAQSEVMHSRMLVLESELSKNRAFANVDEIELLDALAKLLARQGKVIESAEKRRQRIVKQKRLLGGSDFQVISSAWDLAAYLRNYEMIEEAHRICLEILQPGQGTGTNVQVEYLFATLAHEIQKGKSQTGNSHRSHRSIPGWGVVSDPVGDCVVTGAADRISVNIPGLHAGLAQLDGIPESDLRILQEVEGDFSFQVKVYGEFNPGHINPIFNYASCENWAGILLESRDGLKERGVVILALGVEVQVGAGESEDKKPSIKFEFMPWSMSGSGQRIVSNDPYLRIQRKGDLIWGDTSADGKNWNRAFAVSLSEWDSSIPTPKTFRVGVTAESTSMKPFLVEFSESSLVNLK